MALQPVATAMFANSPIYNGKLTGFKSYREHIWANTDPDRCGLLPFVFGENVRFESYVDYALSVPMYFIKRGEDYVDVAGHPFRLYLEGNLPGYEGEYPILQDWEDHLTTLFPEVRLKRFLEMRGVDAADPRQSLALAAFWTGILYDTESLRAAYKMVESWRYDEMTDFLADVSRNGLKAQLRGIPLVDLAKELVVFADDGLKRQEMQDQDARKYLDVLKEIIDSKKTPAQRAIETFDSCDQDIDQTMRTFMQPKTSAISRSGSASKSNLR